MPVFTNGLIWAQNYASVAVSARWISWDASTPSALQIVLNNQKVLQMTPSAPQQMPHSVTDGMDV